MSDNHDMNEIYLRQLEIEGLRNLLRFQDKYLGRRERERLGQELQRLERELTATAPGVTEEE